MELGTARASFSERTRENEKECSTSQADGAALLARAPAQTRPCKPSRRHRASLPASRGASRSARGISSSPGLTSSYPRRAAVCTRGERGRPMREAACALAPGTVTRSAARGDTLQPACTRRWRIAALGGRRYGKAPLPWRAPGGSGRRGQPVRIDRRPRELARVRVLCFSSSRTRLDLRSLSEMARMDRLQLRLRADSHSGACAHRATRLRIDLAEIGEQRSSFRILRRPPRLQLQGRSREQRT